DHQTKDLVEDIERLKTLGVENTNDIDAARNALLQRLGALDQVVKDRISISEERITLASAIQPAYVALHDALASAIANANSDLMSTSEQAGIASAPARKLESLRRLMEME